MRLPEPQDAQPAAPRPTCYRCFRPQARCVCRHVPRVDNQTPVLIVQHPRERFHPFGTAAIAALGLSRVRVVVWSHAGPSLWDRRGVVGYAERWGLDPGAALLYPGVRARPVETFGPGERPPQLVVLDGTWHHARRMYRDTPELRQLPLVDITPLAPSRYRIRREPAPNCLSTIEALVHTLKWLEPDNSELGGLLAAFERMIDDQLEHGRGQPGVPRRRVRRAT